MATDSRASIITLTTDFGGINHYVAQMKAAILGICPSATIVDVNHQITPQDIFQGAWVLSQVVESFPDDTCHVVVVDPGVGTSRPIVVARARGQFFVAPDNGVLSLVLNDGQRIDWIRSLNDLNRWSSRHSRTFHGRDVMAPVAAHLMNGLSLDILGPLQPDLNVRLKPPELKPQQAGISGSVVAIDAFGNLITNIPLAALPETNQNLRIRVGDTENPLEIQGLSGTYADQPTGSVIALIGSNEMLEIAVVDNHAASTCQIDPGVSVKVDWLDAPLP